MKKYLVLTLFMCALYGAEEENGPTLHVPIDKEKVIENSPDKSSPSSLKNMHGHDILEFRAGYFFFTEAYAGKIYGPGTVSLEVENNYWFLSWASGWINFNFTWGSGSPPSTAVSTHMNISCLSGGAKAFLPIDTDQIYRLYLGAGLSAAIIMTKDETAYLPTNLVRFSPGIAVKSGLLICPYKRLAIDLFFDYYFLPTSRSIDLSFYQSLTDVGGFRAGLGLGYLF
ncbi:MAG: hypothetical protein SP4CHLAM5_07920 [Chlamydiia bacterium]|nr:hypothetical protein [Chlamydiia bacterium]MCH9618656.1 hypothetical protein [Chlamydiia bacterium]MCH9623847.1 hypothetical protein [Chlamydiia bacterium]